MTDPAVNAPNANGQTDNQLTGSVPHVVDARGLACPLPLLRLKQAMKQQPDCTVFEVYCTDATSRRDMARYCELAGLAFQELPFEQLMSQQQVLEKKLPAPVPHALNGALSSKPSVTNLNAGNELHVLCFRVSRQG